jgi:hypothetical protein
MHRRKKFRHFGDHVPTLKFAKENALPWLNGPKPSVQSDAEVFILGSGAKSLEFLHMGRRDKCLPFGLMQEHPQTQSPKVGKPATRSQGQHIGILQARNAQVERVNM